MEGFFLNQNYTGTTAFAITPPQIMGDNQNLSERIAALEKAVQQQRPAARRLAWFFGFIILLGLVTYNVSMLRQSQIAQRQTELEHRFYVVNHTIYPARERALAFLQLLAAGNKEWRGAYLDGLNLEGVGLSGIDLQGTDLSGSSLARGVFVGTKFAGCKLRRTDLSGGDLSGANLAGADLYRAQLQRSQLRKANLRGASLEQCELQQATLLAADLADSFLLMANLTGADLSGADLAGANLEAAVLRQANLSLTRLTDVSLKDTDFTDSNWWRSRGLNSDQIALLKRNFTPTEKSPDNLREDYEIWLKKLESSKE
jgi:uncharacterized protein YjbI with pentapeptide repeats